MHSKRRFTLFLSFLLIAIAAITSFGNSAEAATTRSATIDEVIGTVWVQKAGGNLTLRAYSGMSLHQGDQLTTSGDYSSVRLIFPDTKDEITVDKNSDLIFTDLRTEAGYPITRVTVWSGSVFSSVTPIKNEQDIFEVNTPGQTMSAKGTHFLIGVDPLTGTTLIVFAGIVQSNREDSQEDFYPGHQYFLSDSSEDLAESSWAFINPELLMNQIQQQEAILRELLNSLLAINQENEEWLNSVRENLQEGESTPPSFNEMVNQEDLDRIGRNLDRLIENIVASASNNGVVSEAAIREMLAKINSDIDINSPRELELSEAEKARQDALRRITEQTQQQAEEARKKQEEKCLQNQDLLNKIKNERAKQLEQQRLEAEKKKREAEEQLRARMSAQELARFEADKLRSELEQERQNREADAVRQRSEPSPPMPTNPAPNPISKVDRDLAAAIASIPPNLDLYTEESLGALFSAQDLPTGTNEEKVAKTRAILDAVEGLEEAPVVEIGELVLRHLHIQSDGIEVMFEHFEGMNDYKYLINEVEVTIIEDGGMGIDGVLEHSYFQFEADDLEVNHQITLKIVAFDEQEQPLAERTIEFNQSIGDLYLTKAEVVEDSFQLEWSIDGKESSYKLFLDDKMIKEISLTEAPEYTFENLTFSPANLYPIEIKAYNENELVASTTLITDFSIYVYELSPD